jgi:colicin import membrane protein
VLRTARGLIEKTRVEKKADALSYGRKVDAEAKRLTCLIEDIERPLKLSKSLVDDEAERLKREAEEKEHARIAELERIAEQVKEDARKAAIKLEEEDRKKREAELLAERERLAQEQREFRAEAIRIATEQREAQAKIDAQQRKVDDETERLNRIEFERNAKERAVREAEERALRERLDKARADKLQADEEADEQRRIEAARPDLEKIRRLGVAVREFASEPRTAYTTDPARLFAVGVHDELVRIADRCKAYSVATKRTAKKASVPA